MRNLFLLLVLANLAFAAWHDWFAERPRPAQPRDADLPSITLVSEVPADIAELRTARADAPTVILPSDAPVSAAPAPGAGAVVAQEPTARESSAAPAERPAAPPAERSAPPSNAAGAAAATRCTSVGPFRELAQAATAAATLRMAGYQPTQRVAEGDIWIGYWVYIDAIATEVEANAILSKVRAEGVTDSYVIPNSDSGNLVSLGVFSEISGVGRRRDQMRALGYEPKIVDRTRRATVYWVDVVLTAEQTLDFDTLQTPGRIVRLEQRSCEGPNR
jgi:hypothetical protein